MARIVKVEVHELRRRSASSPVAAALLTHDRDEV
jgi:hypothetical protein